LTPERVDELLRFLPLFRKPGRRFSEWVGGGRSPDGTITMPHPVYTADVQEFFRLASQPWWCDREYQQRKVSNMLRDDHAIAAASIELVKAMLTFCVRGERFCDGHWEAMLESGRIQALLQRLEVLR
jgi:hypothetical protein